MKRVLTLATASVVLATSALAVPARNVVLPGADISSITDVKSGLRPTLKTDGKNSLYEDLTGKTIRSTNHSKKKKQRRAPSRITAQGDELYGYLLVSDDDEYEPGLYEFQAEGYEMKWADEDYYDSDEKLMSCWYDDGKIKGYKLRIVAGNPFYYAYCEYDFATGEILENNVVDLEVPVQSCMRYNGCYDPKNDMIYAFGYVAQSNGSFKYGLAKASGSDPLTATLIRGLDTTLPDTPRSMTFNTEDNMLYAIDANSQFLRINPADGSIEVCYTLDLEKEVKYVSGLYYNPIKKIYYWNPNFSDGSSAMATINYNPQNEMFAPRKTKRSLLKNETLLKPPFFKKIFDPASPGIGVAPAQYLNGLRTLSEGHSFSLWVAARPLFRFSLTRPRSTP